ncbi:hypothetical protein DPMN_033365 [Dreissena polymorpha]|uniref:Uncharacterized protein n=1 Tax=Dreissena polymorpha TaxID=45954 RepID=A0A9D4M5Q7_DREPO|nr:hypothetical protein DPMN_033365 [Dreissena polymorpha]
MGFVKFQTKPNVYCIISGSKDNEFADGVYSGRVADCGKATHDVDVSGGRG